MIKLKKKKKTLLFGTIKTLLQLQLNELIQDLFITNTALMILGDQ